MTNAAPALPRLFWIPLSALWTMSLALEGASWVRLSMSGWVADFPTRPRIDVRKISAGNIASTA